MKSVINQIESELFDFFKNRQGFVRVADILSELDISSISEKIEHKHPIFSVESLLRLYLYKRIKGTSIYLELLKEVEEDKEKLGFTELPQKRTFNKFVQKKIDKLLMDNIAELILKISTQKGLVLDIQLVKKTLEKKRKEINRYQKEIREATKLVKRLVYPQIDLKIHHNATFTTKNLLDVLVHVAQNNDFCNNGAMTFKELNPDKKVPHGDTIMHHFNKFDSVEEIRTVFERIFDVIFNFVRKEYHVLKKRKVDIAIDIHKIPYYGGEIDYVTAGKHERGTTKFFSFLTCAIVVDGARFTIDAIPINELDILSHLIDRMIKRVKGKVRIHRVYLDRGFNRVKVINVLKDNKVKFVMPMMKLETVKAWFDKAENSKARVINLCVKRLYLLYKDNIFKSQILLHLSPIMYPAPNPH